MPSRVVATPTRTCTAALQVLGEHGERQRGQCVVQHAGCTHGHLPCRTSSGLWHDTLRDLPGIRIAVAVRQPEELDRRRGLGQLNCDMGCCVVDVHGDDRPLLAGMLLDACCRYRVWVGDVGDGIRVRRTLCTFIARSERFECPAAN